MKYCKDCKWVKEKNIGLGIKEYYCANPKTIRITESEHPVTGRTRYMYKSLCFDQRRSDYDDYCGPEGKFYEERVTYPWYSLENLKFWKKD